MVLFRFKIDLNTFFKKIEIKKYTNQKNQINWKVIFNFKK